MGNLEKFSIEDLFSYAYEGISTGYGIKGLMIFKKEEKENISSIGVAFDKHSYSGIKIQINRKWFTDKLYHNIEEIERICQLHVVRILNHHFKLLLKTPDYKRPGWAIRGSCASQIAGGEVISFGIPHEYPKDLSMEEYLYYICKEPGIDIPLTPVQGEDYSEAIKGLESKVGLAPLRLANSLNKSSENLPYDIQEMIKKQLSPHYKVPWVRLLENGLSSSVCLNIVSSYRHINKAKLGLLGIESIKKTILFPGQTLGTGPSICLMMDQSASIQKKELEDIFKVLLAIKRRSNIKIFVVPFDTEPGKWYECNDQSDIVYKREKMGGTRIDLVMKWVIEESPFRNEISSILVATDGYSPILNESVIPKHLDIFWLLTDNAASDITYGRKIWLKASK